MPGPPLPDPGRGAAGGDRIDMEVVPSTIDLRPPDEAELDHLLAWWETANYLTVGQIYLQANPLLREPLRPEHIKPRLLGHWGTSPGLSLVYAHLNRLINATGDDVLFLAGPGHGGPAVVANVYLEGTYSEVYPEVSADEDGLLRLVRQFSTPGGIPSHVSVPTPGSIHEGGELGYALVHAFGAAFDNPDLLVACVIGDGEAETAPLEGSWKGIRFLNPARDGAVLPILHLNEYKISGPTVLGRASEEEIATLLAGHGYAAHFVEGDDPRQVHRELRRDPGRVPRRAIAAIQAATRGRGGPVARRAGRRSCCARRRAGPGRRWSTGSRSRAPSAPTRCRCKEVRTNPEHLAMLEEWMRCYRPEELLRRRTAGCVTSSPRWRRGARSGWGRARYANGGRRLVPLDLPDPPRYAIERRAPGRRRGPNRPAGSASCCATSTPATPRPPTSASSAPTRRTPTGSAPSSRSRTAARSTPAPGDDHVSPDGRVMEVLSEHNCQGWLEGYLLTGRHGLFATYEAFAMVSASMAIQHTKWLEEVRRLDWRAPVASLNVLLTSTCWRNDHNGFSHQGPGLIDTMISLRGEVVRVYLPPDANMPAVRRRPLPAQPRLRQPDRDRQAAAAAVPRPTRTRSSTARGRRLALGLGRATATTTPTWCSPPPATSRRWRSSPPPSCCAQHAPELRRAGRQRRRPDVAVPGRRPPARPRRARLRGPLRPPTARSSSPSTATPRAIHQLLHGRAAAGPLPRPRLQRAGDDDDALRHGRAATG